jgi:ABC-type transport system substrate-binding protein
MTPQRLSRVPLTVAPLANPSLFGTAGCWRGNCLLYSNRAVAGSLAMTKRLDWVRWCAVSTVVLIVALGVTAEAKTFRWANDGDPTTMDPHARADLFVTTFDMNMYEALLRRDRDLKLEPALATEWSNIDPTTWRFKLRQGVKFHDGTPFTVDDVIFSVRRATAPGSDLAGQLATVKEVKKVDDNTVDFITDGPAPILPNYLAGIAIMSKAWCEAHNTTSAAMLKDEESYATRNANGTGPFMLKDRQPAVRTVLDKNPNWWGIKQQPIDVDEVVSPASRTLRPASPPSYRASSTWSTTCPHKTSSASKKRKG